MTVSTIARERRGHGAHAVEVEAGGERGEPLRQLPVGLAAAAQFLGHRLEVAHRADRDGLAQPGREAGAANRVGDLYLTGLDQLGLLDELHAQMRHQGGEHRFGLHRLGHVGDAARFLRLPARVPQRTRGHGNNRNVRGRLVCPELSRRGEAVEIGHPHIHEDHVGTMPPGEVESFETAGRRDHAEPCAFEQAGQDPPADRAVVDHERGHMLTGREPRVQRRIGHVRIS